MLSTCLPSWPSTPNEDCVSMDAASFSQALRWLLEEVACWEASSVWVWARVRETFRSRTLVVEFSWDLQLIESSRDKLIYNTSQLKAHLSQIAQCPCRLVLADCRRREGRGTLKGRVGVIVQYFQKGGRMDNSQLIVFTFNQPLYCCCFVQGSLMACSSNSSIVFWDFAEGKNIASYKFHQEIAPISITTLKLTHQRATLLLQLKETRVLILSFQRESKEIQICQEYQLDMIGFTRLPITCHHYDKAANLKKMIGEHFWTIRYSNTIEKRQILTGKLQREMQVDETKFEEVCYLLNYSIQNTNYLLVAEEGGTFKQFALLENAEIVQPNKTLSLAAKSEITIVLWIEPMPNYKAYVCMRNDHVFIIDLKELLVEQQLKITAFRIIKEIPHSKQEKLYAISSKSEISLLKDNTLKCRQKVNKSFIMDIDTFQWGVIGATEEGKIIFLPLL